jgi:hypothetical protein
MSKVLVSIQDNYADEFDFGGFVIMSEEDWSEVKAGIPEGPFEAYLGTNEFQTYKGKEDYLKNVTVETISEEDEATLRRLLHMSQYGSGYGLFVISSENY